MHTVTLTKPVQWRDRTLDAGNWLMDDSNAAAMLNAHGPAVSLERWMIAGSKPDMLFVRPGGYGDILMLTPFMRSAYASGRRVRLSTLRPEAAENLAWVETVPYPIREREVGSWHIPPLDGMFEFHPDMSRRNSYELIGEACGIDLPERDRVPVHVVTDSEIEAAKAWWPRTRRHRVAVQLAASSPVRTWPNTPQFIAMLRMAGIETALCCGPNDRIETDITTDWMRTTRGLGWRESAAIVGQCDAVVAPDSAMTHLAAALGVPCVALFGSFHWRLRTATYPLCRAIQGVAPCAPCCHHGRGSRWPIGAPCVTSERCEALASIEPERVWREVKRVLP